MSIKKQEKNTKSFSPGFTLASGIFWALSVLIISLSASTLYFSSKNNPDNLNTNLAVTTNQLQKTNPSQSSREEEEAKTNPEENKLENKKETDSTQTTNQEETLTIITPNQTSQTILSQTQTLREESDPLFLAWDKQDGIKIKESQIKDLQDYLTEEADPLFLSWDKTTGITIQESQISDLQNYLTSIAGLNISLLINDSNYITDGNTNWDNSYGFITNLSSFTTDNLTQGTTNLYSQWVTSGSNISYTNGNVGIGTTSPGYKLDVAGAINATSVLVNGVAVGVGGTQWANGSGGVISYTGGNVGIGTTTPGRPRFSE